VSLRVCWWFVVLFYLLMSEVVNVPETSLLGFAQFSSI
jgi:hypothetical protein